MHSRFSKYLWIFLLLCYLFLCVTAPIGLQIEEDSCFAGTTELRYVICNRIILPYRGYAFTNLEKQEGESWADANEPRVREDLGITFGLLDMERGEYALRKPLEAGTYRLTVRCDYSLLGMMEQSKVFTIE